MTHPRRAGVGTAAGVVVALLLIPHAASGQLLPPSCGSVQFTTMPIQYSFHCAVRRWPLLMWPAASSLRWVRRRPAN